VKLLFDENLSHKLVQEEASLLILSIGATAL
jgi:hypothetical protein